MNWDDIKKKSIEKATLLGDDYVKRLKVEIKEIEKQGANIIWVDYVQSNRKFEHNKNGLVLPFLLDLINIDPIKVEMTYVLDDSGVAGDVVDIIINDESVTIPGDALVKTKRGIIRACLLQVGDEVE